MDSFIMYTYVVKYNGDYYLKYTQGADSLTVSGQSKKAYVFGTYEEADTGTVDAFLQKLREIENRYDTEICTPIPDTVTEKGTISYYRDDTAMNRYIDDEMDFENCEFSKDNDTKTETTYANGKEVTVNEVPGSDGKLLYVVYDHAAYTEFYVKAESVDKNMRELGWSEFEDKVNEVINSVTVFKLPWS